MKTLILIFLFGCMSTKFVGTNGEYYAAYEYNTSGNVPVLVKRDSYFVLTDSLIIIERESLGVYFQVEYDIVCVSCLKYNHCVYKTDGLVEFEMNDCDLMVYKINLKDGKKDGIDLIYFYSSLRKVKSPE